MKRSTEVGELALVDSKGFGFGCLGHKSLAHLWVETLEIELDVYENMVFKIAQDFKPFYKKMHAYLRFKLKEKYPDLVDEKGLIPVHLTKNMHGQEWNYWLDMLQPYGEVRQKSDVHLTFKTFQKTIRVAVCVCPRLTTK